MDNPKPIGAVRAGRVLVEVYADDDLATDAAPGIVNRFIIEHLHDTERGLTDGAAEKCGEFIDRLMAAGVRQA